MFQAHDTVSNFFKVNLVAYKQEHGHCLVPQGYSEGPKLGQWVHKQRLVAKAGKLSDARKESLESMELYLLGLCDRNRELLAVTKQ
ncbi:hypothetical protein ACHAXR_008994 [Thalassiosira sp. AJA248-18]